MEAAAAAIMHGTFLPPLAQKVTEMSVLVVAAQPAEVQQWSCVLWQGHGFFTLSSLTTAAHDSVHGSLQLQL